MRNFWIQVGSGLAVALISFLLLKKFSHTSEPKKKVIVNGKIKSIKDLTSMVIDEQNEKFIITLHPLIRDKVRKLISDWRKGGFEIRITSGYRSYKEQEKIYNQGRSKDSIAKKEPIVSYALPGTSFHNYGLAIDTIPIINGKATYDFDYSKLKPIAIKNGFEWGGDWKKPDKPHFQFTFGKKEKDLLTLYKSGKKDNNDYVQLA